MNDIINWIATHNTLMIRTGFTAILVLIIIYMYRFFFVAKVEVVPEAMKAKQKTEASEAAAEKSLALEVHAAEINSKNNEIESLKAEAVKLKTQLTDAESQIENLKAGGGAESANSAEPAPAAAPTPTSDAEGADTDLIASLNAKIAQLQARLTEYEIIAEDISEIGQLREENSELKKKLNEGAASAKTETIEAPEIELETSSEPELNSNEMNLVSEKDVSENEKQLLDHFEEAAQKKGS